MNDALLETLRQQVAAGGSLTDALAGAAGGDPALALLSQMLTRREQALEQELETQAEGERLEARRQREDERLREDARAREERQRQDLRRARLERLRWRLGELEGELAAAQTRLDDLALALGACPDCWGEDPGCRLCRGRGGPGFLRPDPAAFGRWIVPALPDGSALSPAGGAASGPAPVATPPGGYVGAEPSPTPERTQT